MPQMQWLGDTSPRRGLLTQALGSYLDARIRKSVLGEGKEKKEKKEKVVKWPSQAEIRFALVRTTPIGEQPREAEDARNKMLYLYGKYPDARGLLASLYSREFGGKLLFDFNGEGDTGVDKGGDPNAVDPNVVDHSVGDFLRRFWLGEKKDLKEKNLEEINLEEIAEARLNEGRTTPSPEVAALQKAERKRLAQDTEAKPSPLLETVTPIAEKVGENVKEVVAGAKRFGSDIAKTPHAFGAVFDILDKFEKTLRRDGISDAVAGVSPYMKGYGNSINKDMREVIRNAKKGAHIVWDKVTAETEKLGEKAGNTLYNLLAGESWYSPWLSSKRMTPEREALSKILAGRQEYFQKLPRNDSGVVKAMDERILSQLEAKRRQREREELASKNFIKGGPSQ